MAEVIPKQIPMQLLHDELIYKLNIYWVLDPENPKDSYVLLFQSPVIRKTLISEVSEYIVMFKSETKLQKLLGPATLSDCENLIERSFKFKEKIKVIDAPITTVLMTGSAPMPINRNQHGPFKVRESNEEIRKTHTALMFSGSTFEIETKNPLEDYFEYNKGETFKL